MLNLKYVAVMMIAIMVVSVTVIALSDGSDGASSYTARVFVGDGTDSGTTELSGTGEDIEGILYDALSGRISINANGTVRSLDGVENTDTENWYILQWRPPTGWVSVLANSSGDAYLDDGTSYYVYYSDVSTDSGGRVTYSTPSSFEPVSTSYFFIKFVTDANANSYVTSILTEEQRLQGFWISGEGSDIAEAFRNACSDLRAMGLSGFELVINDDPDDELYGWLGSFMGLEDDDSPGGGLWNNWSQFSWNDSTGRWEYNNWCLGYYDPGVYPYFSVVRQITEDDSATAGTDVTPSDIPQELIDGTCTVRFVDGDGTVIKTQTVPYFGSATAPSNPTKDPENGITYTFTGWDTAFDQVISDITVTAQFSGSDSPETPSDPDEPGGDGVSTTGVSLSMSELRLEIGASRTLVATVSPSDASDRSVTWTSSDTSVATVGSSGTVTAVGEGTATITVRTSDGGYTATCEVSVVPVGTPLSIDLDFECWTATVGGEAVLGYVFNDGASGSVTWSSDDTGVVTVDVDGRLTAVGQGTANVTATVVGTDLSATCTVYISSDADQTLEFEASNDGNAWSGTILDGTGSDSNTYTMNAGSAGSVSFTSSTYSLLADETGIRISVTALDDSDLTSPQMQIVESLRGDVQLFEYQINGSGSDDLGGTVTVRMPYSFASGDDSDSIHVYHIDARGELEEFDCTYSDGYVTFETTHFSVYFATSEDLSSGQSDDASGDGSSNTMLYVGIVAAIIVVIAIAAVILMRRNA